MDTFKILIHELTTDPIAITFMVISILGVSYSIYLFFWSKYWLWKLKKQRGPIDKLEYMMALLPTDKKEKK